MILWKTALMALALYGALIGLLALLQTPMLFPRSMVGPAPPLPTSAERQVVHSRDGAELHGVLIPGTDPDAPLLLGFGGNAWNAESVALFLHQIAPEHAVAAFHFRGYAPSTGRPSARALMRDAPELYDALAAPGGVIAVGFSIGAGPAAHLAAQRDLRGVVLVTPFDRLRKVAQASFPWAPVRWLFRHDMHPLAELRAADSPVALLIAAQDEIIPPARATALAEGLAAAGQPPRYIDRITARHNTIYDHPDFAPSLRAAIDAVQGN